MNPDTTPGAFRRCTAAPIRRLAAVAAVGLTASLLGAPTASAGTNERIKTDGGIVTFKHYDEEITAEDTQVDGLGVEAVLVWTDSDGINHTEHVIDATGADNLSKFKDLSIPEGARVALTLCYVDDQGPLKCSRPQSAEA